MTTLILRMKKGIISNLYDKKKVPRSFQISVEKRAATARSIAYKKKSETVKKEIVMKEYIDVYSFEQLEEYILKGVQNLRLMFDPAGMFDEISPEAMELINNNQYLVSDWDVSNVTNMSDMFVDLYDFNQPLNNWDVSNVTDMTGVFSGTNFNQPLDKWDVSNVTHMDRMFYYAEFFNQPLNNWNVSKVLFMDGMFEGAKAFNQPLNEWDFSNTISMIEMFQDAKAFNQDVSNWNVGEYTSVRDIFNNSGLKYWFLRR